MTAFSRPLYTLETGMIPPQVAFRAESLGELTILLTPSFWHDKFHNEEVVGGLPSAFERCTCLNVGGLLLKDEVGLHPVQHAADAVLPQHRVDHLMTMPRCVLPSHWAISRNEEKQQHQNRAFLLAFSTLLVKTMLNDT